MYVVNIWVFSIFQLLWAILPWTLVCKYLFRSLLSIILGPYPVVELLNYLVVICLAEELSTVLHCIAQGFQFFHILTISNACEMVSYFCFDLHLPNGLWCWSLFHVPIDHLYIFLKEILIEVLYPFLNWIICFLLSCKSSLYTLDILYKIYMLYKYLFWELFHFLDESTFDVQKFFFILFFKFSEVQFICFLVVSELWCHIQEITAKSNVIMLPICFL